MARSSGALVSLFGVALLAVGLPLRPAAAVEPPVIALSTPPGCPDGQALAASIRELAGRDFDPGDVRLDVTSRGAVWHAELTLPDGRRELDGESCAAVLDAAAVVVALWVERQNPDPAGGASGNSAEVSTGAALPVQPPATSLETSIPSTELAPARPRDRALRLRVQAGVMGEVGLLPAPSLGPRLRLMFERGLFSVDVGAVALLARRARLLSGESAEIYWFAGQVAGCRKVHGELRACFGGEAGRIVGTGSGVDVPATSAGTWLALTADASFRGALAEPFSWEAGLGAAAAMVFSEFGFDDLGTLHRPSSVSGRLFASVGWQ